jgi:hypothetical protein
VRLSRAHIFGGGVATLAVVALAITVFFPPASKPEELLKERVVRMARAAEERDASFILQQASSRFRFQDGMNKDDLRGFLMSQFLGARWLRVFIPELEVHLTGPRTAEVSGHFIFGRSRAKALKDLAKDSVLGHYQVDLEAERESDGQWRFISASYRAIEPLGQVP